MLLPGPHLTTFVSGLIVLLLIVPVLLLDKSYEEEESKERNSSEIGVDIVDISIANLKVQLREFFQSHRKDYGAEYYQEIVDRDTRYRIDSIDTYVDQNVQYMDNVISKIDSSLSNIAQEVEVLNETVESEGETEFSSYNDNEGLVFEEYNSLLASFNSTYVILPRDRLTYLSKAYPSLNMPLSNSLKDEFNKLSEIGILSPVIEVSITSMVSGATRAFPAIYPMARHEMDAGISEGKLNSFESINVGEGEKEEDHKYFKIPKEVFLRAYNTDRRTNSGATSMYDNADVLIMMEDSSSLTPEGKVQIREAASTILESLSQDTYVTLALFGEIAISVDPASRTASGKWNLYSVAKSGALLKRFIMDGSCCTSINPGRIGTLEAVIRGLESFQLSAGVFGQQAVRSKVAFIVLSGFIAPMSYGSGTFTKTLKTYNAIEFVCTGRPLSYDGRHLYLYQKINPGLKASGKFVTGTGGAVFFYSTSSQSSIKVHEEQMRTSQHRDGVLFQNIGDVISSREYMMRLNRFVSGALCSTKGMYADSEYTSKILKMLMLSSATRGLVESSSYELIKEMIGEESALPLYIECDDEDGTKGCARGWNSDYIQQFMEGNANSSDSALSGSKCNYTNWPPVTLEGYKNNLVDSCKEALDFHVVPFKRYVSESNVDTAAKKTIEGLLNFVKTIVFEDEGAQQKADQSVGTTYVDGDTSWRDRKIVGLYVLADSFIGFRSSMSEFNSDKKENKTKYGAYCDTYKVDCLARDQYGELSLEVKPHHKGWSKSVLFEFNPFIAVPGASVVDFESLAEESIYHSEYFEMPLPGFPFSGVDQAYIRRSLFLALDKIASRDPNLRVSIGRFVGSGPLLTFTKPVYLPTSEVKFKSLASTVNAIFRLDRLFQSIGCPTYQPSGPGDSETEIRPLRPVVSKDLAIYFVRSPLMVSPLNFVNSPTGCFDPRPPLYILGLFLEGKWYNQIYQIQGGEKSTRNVDAGTAITGDGTGLTGEYWDIIRDGSVTYDANSVLHEVFGTTKAKNNRIFMEGNVVIWKDISGVADVKLMLVKRYNGSDHDEYVVTLDENNYSVGCDEEPSKYLDSVYDIYAQKSGLIDRANKYEGDKAIFSLPSTILATNTNDTVSSKYRDMSIKVAGCIDEELRTITPGERQLYDMLEGCNPPTPKFLKESCEFMFKGNFQIIHSEIWTHRHVLATVKEKVNNNKNTIKFVSLFSAHTNINTVYPGYSFDSNTGTEYETFPGTMTQQDSVSYSIMPPKSHFNSDFTSSFKTRGHGDVEGETSTFYQNINLMSIKITGCKNGTFCTTYGSVTIALVSTTITDMLHNWLIKYGIVDNFDVFLVNEYAEILASTAASADLGSSSGGTSRNVSATKFPDAAPASATSLLIADILEVRHLASNSSNKRCKVIYIARDIVEKAMAGTFPQYIKVQPYLSADHPSDSPSDIYVSYIANSNLFAFIVGKGNYNTNQNSGPLHDFFEESCSGMVDGVTQSDDTNYKPWFGNHTHTESTTESYSRFLDQSSTLLSRASNEILPGELIFILIILVMMAAVVVFGFCKRIELYSYNLMESKGYQVYDRM